MLGSLKTPLRYDADDETLEDADGNPIALLYSYCTPAHAALASLSTK